MHFKLYYLKKAHVHHWSLRVRVGKIGCDNNNRLTSQDTSTLAFHLLQLIGNCVQWMFPDC